MSTQTGALQTTGGGDATPPHHRGRDRHRLEQAHGVEMRIRREALAGAQRYCLEYGVRYEREQLEQLGKDELMRRHQLDAWHTACRALRLPGPAMAASTRTYLSVGWSRTLLGGVISASAMASTLSARPNVREQHACSATHRPSADS